MTSLKAIFLAWIPRLLLVYAMAWSSVAFAQSLPIEDGTYFTQRQCSFFELGELAGNDFKISNEGSTVDFLSSSCVVASVSEIRSGRLDVELDCSEFGETYKTSIILDVIGPTEVRRGGELYEFCDAYEQSGGEYPSLKSTEELIQMWFDLNEDCRGGSGDDPKTEIACTKRSSVHQVLQFRQLCFGKNDQSRSEFRWHRCENSSITYWGS